METTTALPAPAHAQIPTSLTETHTPPAVPAHIVQAAPPAIKPMPASPAPSEAAAQTAPPAAPATTPTVTDPAKVADITTVDHNAPTTAPIDTEAEAKLTSAILQLWGDRKNANTAVRRTRAEMKVLRLALAEKLYAMKAILVGTGREGRWAPYLREQRLPVATADRLVGGHQATLAAPKDKLVNEELPATVDEVRKLAQKLLPKLAKVITTAELAFAFIDELFWNLEAAEGRETDDGVEVFRASHEDETSDEDQIAEQASPTPAVP